MNDALRSYLNVLGARIDCMNSRDYFSLQSVNAQHMGNEDAGDVITCFIYEQIQSRQYGCMQLGENRTSLAE